MEQKLTPEETVAILATAPPLGDSSGYDKFYYYCQGHALTTPQT